MKKLICSEDMIKQDYFNWLDAGGAKYVAHNHLFSDEHNEMCRNQLKRIVEQHETDQAYIKVLKNAVDRYQSDEQSPDSEGEVDEGLAEKYWKEINYCFVGANTEIECKDSVKKIVKQLLQQGKS